MVTSQKVVATMRLRIERVQGGVALLGVCRKANLLTVGGALATLSGESVDVIFEISEMGLTQSEHFFELVS